MKLKPLIAVTTATSLLMLGGCFSTDLGFAYDKDGIDTQPAAQEKPELTEMAAIDVSLSKTPQYTFNSTQAGTIHYSGACSSATDNASAGENTISFNALAWNTEYSDCEITVEDASGQVSDSLAVSSFRVIKPFPLNDTGSDFCADDTRNYKGDSVAKVAGCSTTASTHPNQDADSGRDYQQLAGTLPAKIGGGAAGFDYTRIKMINGVRTEEQAGDNWVEWDCVRDNVTGLEWEVKTNNTPKDLHDIGERFTWYNPDMTTNGGRVGTIGGDACLGGVDCNTHGFVVRVNAQSLCGESDWRLPTIDELRSIVHRGKASPMIDTDYFGLTASPCWSSTPSGYYGWLISFVSGNDDTYSSGNSHYSVRLVRGGY